MTVTDSRSFSEWRPFAELANSAFLLYHVLFLRVRDEDNGVILRLTPEQTVFGAFLYF
jgi:hypothetical protein